MSKILVTGATGQLGAGVIENLLKKTSAANIKAMVRDAAKAANLKAKGVEIVPGDYNDYNSLVAAFNGVEKLYLVSGTDIANREIQQQNAVRAAVEAGVKHVLYTSFQRKNDTETSPIYFLAKSHLSTEKAIKESGLAYTLLLDALYADIILVFAGEQMLPTKTLAFPAKDGKAAFILRAHLAEAGAVILLDETGKYNNASLEFTGAEAVSWQQIADKVSQITGEKINYVSPQVDDYVAALHQAKVPQEYIGMLAGFGQATEQGDFANVSPVLENILGRKPVSVFDYLETVYKSNIIKAMQVYQPASLL